MQENFQRKTILREVFAALSTMQAVENISSNYYYLGSEISEERHSKCTTTFMNESIMHGMNTDLFVFCIYK